MKKQNISDKTKTEYITIPVCDIIPYSKNNRKHTKKDINEIIKSIQKDGYISPIIIDEKNIILAGHGRLFALKKLKIKEIQVLRISGLSEKQKGDYRIRDNTTSLLADFDLENLRIELADLGDFSTDLFDHFSDFGIDLWGEDENKVYNEEIEDEIPEIEGKIYVKTGDIFQLGNHFLKCGDATKEKDVWHLLARGDSCGTAGVVDLVLTDPPYLMNYEGAIGGDGEKRKIKKIQNDDLKGTEALNFLEGFLKIIKKYCRGSWYVFFYRLGLQNIFKALENQRMQYRNVIIWKKEHLTLSPTDYKSTYEPIVNGWNDDYTPIFYGRNEEHKFYGKKGEVDFIDLPVSSILENERTKKNDLHPTMKPISLLEKILNNSSLEKHKVLDLFGGSGSTLIACEKKDRVCYMMELDPEYVQVIIKRFYDITGRSKEIKCLNRFIDFSFLKS